MVSCLIYQTNVIYRYVIFGLFIIEQTRAQTVLCDHPEEALHNLAHCASLLANETRTAPSRARSHVSTLHRRCVATRAHQVEPTARSTRQFFALAIRLTITIH